MLILVFTDKETEAWRMINFYTASTPETALMAYVRVYSVFCPTEG